MSSIICRILRRAGGASIIVIAASGAAQAQSTVSWGELEGRLVDPVGQSVVGATVTLERGLAREAVVTDQNGSFVFVRILPGSYQLQVTAEGFAPHSVDAIVRPGVASTLAIQLTAMVELAELTVETSLRPGSTMRAPDISSRGLVLAGTGNTIIQIDGMPANISEKTVRQIYGRVPGAFVYDMDGSGNQVNVSTRGLDAHRSWEMNVRQDGVLLNTDLYGYPASHYSPPMEAIGRVELIRGTAALQYGSQYGGLANYVTKAPRANEPFGVESISTVGSFGLRSTYNAVGGEVGRVTYYGYMNMRHSDGYRTGSTSDAEAQYLSATFRVTPEVSVRGQVGRSAYVYRMPGPLTDAMFKENPRQRTRERDWYEPDITIPALVVDWRRENGLHLTSTASAVLGPRNSVLRSGFANQPDLPAADGEYPNRVVQVDRYLSLTSETRLIQPWSMRGLEQSLAVGATIFRNRTIRQAQGRGTTGTDYDLSLVGDGGYAVDVKYLTLGGAVYMENLFRVTPRLTIVPGIRVEAGRTDLRGDLAYYDPGETPQEIEHTYPLFGVRGTYQWEGGTEAYGGWTQSFRPQLLQNALPGNPDERTDPDIKDSRGWTVEAGIRGTLARRFGYDVSVFELRINDRFGRVLRMDPDGTSYLFRTNEGDSRTRGVELSVEAWLIQLRRFTLLAHTATAYMKGTYLNGKLLSGGENVDIAGNAIQSVPEWISRSGLTAESGAVSVNFLLSHTSSSFADALNTIEPTANGAVGLVPAHTLVDVNAGMEATDWLRVRAGVNNLFDEQYFTKRPEFYPGPGIWPGDGRSLQVTVELRYGALN